MSNHPLANLINLTLPSSVSDGKASDTNYCQSIIGAYALLNAK